MKKAVAFVTICVFIIGAMSIEQGGEHKQIKTGNVVGVTKEVNELKNNKSLITPTPTSISPTPSILSLPPASVVSSSPVSTPISSKLAVSHDEVRLLDKELIVENETHVFGIPDDWYFDDGEPTFAEVKFKIVTEEDAEVFDDPGFTFSINDESVYALAAQELECNFVQQAVCESDVLTRTFVIDDVRQPKSVSVWAGNNGDDQKLTSAVIFSISLYHQPINSAIVELAAIEQLKVWNENADYLSLEWLSPTITSAQLGKALRYELKIGDDSASIVLPSLNTFLPKKAGELENILIKKALNSAKLVSIRAIDWKGVASQWQVVEF